MNNKEMISGFHIKSELTDSVSNSKQNNLISTFNGKKIKIVVAARQYNAKNNFTRGYGDIASGVRGLEYLMKIYPAAQFSFVFEHFADCDSEFARIKTITTIPSVKTFVLYGRKKDGIQLCDETWKQVHQENEVKQLLEDADFIFHGPSGLISPLKDSKGEYAKKTLGVSEYEVSNSYYDENEPHGIAQFEMGLNFNRIYINEPVLHDNQFQDNVLRTNCSNPILDNKVNTGKNKFYFYYPKDFRSLAQMVRLIMLIEGDDARNINMVNCSSFSFNKEIFQEADLDNLLLESCPYQAVKLCGINSNNEHEELIIYENPQGNNVKNIHLITPAALNNNDLQLLERGSVINYSSGDISTSDVLAIGKIPICGISGKKRICSSLLYKMEAFCMIKGNEQYKDLMDVWELAVSSFTRNAKMMLSQKSLAELNSLQQLRSLKWQEFEREFTGWLKDNNQTETFIRDKAEAIISKSAWWHPQICAIC